MKTLLFFILSLCISYLNAQESENTQLLPDGSCVSGNCDNGFGVKKYQDGTIYIGEWWNDVPSGKGTVIWADGSIYVGQFIKGLYHGNGTLMNNKEGGALYIGEFNEDLPDGFGTMFFSDGGFYVGQMKEGTLDGQGCFQHNNGTLEEGLWKKGQITGDVIFKAENHIKRATKE